MSLPQVVVRGYKQTIEKVSEVIMHFLMKKNLEKQYKLNSIMK